MGPHARVCFEQLALTTREPGSNQTRTQSLFMSLWERERRLDSIEARAVTWEGAKEKERLADFVRCRSAFCHRGVQLVFTRKRH